MTFILKKAYNEINWDYLDDSTLESVVGYRLPSINEWEYAARGGSSGSTTIYSGSNTIDDVAWYWRNSGDSYLTEWNRDTMILNNCRPHSVGEKQANELGIYDMI